MQATDRTVYVGNVGKEVDEAALLALFGHCGAVGVGCSPETAKWVSFFGGEPKWDGLLISCCGRRSLKFALPANPRTIRGMLSSSLQHLRR